MKIRHRSVSFRIKMIYFFLLILVQKPGFFLLKMSHFSRVIRIRLALEVTVYFFGHFLAKIRDPVATTICEPFFDDHFHDSICPPTAVLALH